jgi:hypothetical protein
VRPTSPQQVGPISRTGRDPRTRGWDQWRARRRGQATIVASHGDFQHPSRPGHATHRGYSPTPKVNSGGLDGSWSHFGAPARSAGLQSWSVGLSFGWPPRPWLRVVRPIIFPFLLSLTARSDYNIHFHTHTHTQGYWKIYAITPMSPRIPDRNESGPWGLC